MIGNAPVSISVNTTSTSIVTSGGGIYHAGLVNGKIQPTFKEIVANADIQGQIIDSQSTDDKIYLLNSAGTVFEYDYNVGGCSPIVREVYSSAVCGGDPAVKIDTGRAHVVILTAAHRVFGAGCNGQYQIVPQGQCKYDVATEILITDTNHHDNHGCCDKFVGFLDELENPIIPSRNGSACNKVSCIKDTVFDKEIGTFTIPNITISSVATGTLTGNLTFPIKANYSYVGFLCVDDKGLASGNVTYTINNIYIPAGCHHGIFTTITNHPIIIDLDLTNTTLVQFLTSDVVATVPVEGPCNAPFDIDLTTVLSLPIISATVGSEVNSLLLTIIDDTIISTTTLSILPKPPLNAYTIIPFTAPIPLTESVILHIFLNCCRSQTSLKPTLPQPCWMNVYAGSDLTVLVDSCNRLYVLGSLHEIRNNKTSLRRNCLEDLLSKANASITLPADQLNCCVRPLNKTCKCVKCPERKFCTDLSKFGIKLDFDGNNGDCECEEKRTTVCEFLKALQNCNEAPLCDDTCEPCDGYIYLNINDCSDCVESLHIKSITLLNKRSVCKAISQRSHPIPVDVFQHSLVEYDLNRYCIDGNDYDLSEMIVLVFPGSENGAHIKLFINIDGQGGIQFNTHDKKCNVEFTVDVNTSTQQFLLNYGPIMDPVVLTNLKFLLVDQSIFPCSQFKNPFDTKIFNTYLRGGDCVKFIRRDHQQRIKLAITADVPTVFRMNRRVLDVGVGNNNISVLIGGLACPNEIMAIGKNCYGELGIGSNETIVCWKQVNRCLFDCQVNKIYSGNHVTFYITQTGRIYAAGLWKCLVNSTQPVTVSCIPASWKIREIAISQNQIVLLGGDGNLYGVGDNSLGELGLCHVECVPKPSPIPFFFKMGQSYAREFANICASSHPLERNACNRRNVCDRQRDDVEFEEITEDRFFRRHHERYYPNERVYRRRW
uniref:Uncharacterized protein n=1 Tax=viral metagenome TaxID=1070528 RepID=A0A6C0LT83_9ZZZZ